MSTAAQFTLPVAGIIVGLAFSEWLGLALSILALVISIVALVGMVKVQTDVDNIVNHSADRLEEMVGKAETKSELGCE